MKLKVKILIVTFLISIAVFGVISLVYENATYTKVLIARNEEARLAEQEAKRNAEEEARRKAEEEEANEIKVQYDVQNDYTTEGLALVKKDGKWGYIDKNRNEKIPLIYDVANNFSQGLAKVKKDDLWGYINTEGEEVIPINYYYCGDISNGTIIVGKGAKYGFMTVAGKEICGLLYDRVEPFSERGLAKVILDRKYGFIDTDGNIAVEIKHESNEENEDFTGTWQRTEVHSSLKSELKIKHQMATSFEFEITTDYYSVTDKIVGLAEITGTNTAKFVFDAGKVQDIITFSMIEGDIQVTSKLNGNVGLTENSTIIGKYTKGEPVYENQDIVEKLFSKGNAIERIKNALGEELYEEEFLYGLENGIHEIKTMSTSAAIRGSLYRVYIPTTDRDFKILVNADNVYFYSKNRNVYKTDDTQRQERIPASISYDD